MPRGPQWPEADARRWADRFVAGDAGGGMVKDAEWAGIGTKLAQNPGGLLMGYGIVAKAFKQVPPMT
jgi:hypothetical protein